MLAPSPSVLACGAFLEFLGFSRVTLSGFHD